MVALMLTLDILFRFTVFKFDLIVARIIQLAPFAEKTEILFKIKHARLSLKLDIFLNFNCGFSLVIEHYR